MNSNLQNISTWLRNNNLIQPPPQALRFSHGRGVREASDWWWTARDHGRVQTAVSFPPSFEGTFSSKERRLGTRQNLIHSWYWAWRKHVTSRDCCYPIGCQILHVLSILYRILQWTDLWIKTIVCLCLQERFCCCTKPQRYMVSESGSNSRFLLFNNVIWTSTLVNSEFRKRLKHTRQSTEWGTTTRTSCSSTDIYQ